MNRISRRNFGAATSALGFSGMLGSTMAHAIRTQQPSGTFKRCVVLWMSGGPSQMDTFDPKDLADGSSESIATNVDHVRFGKSLPNLAKYADRLCLVRSVGSREGEHERATELLHTGFAPQPSFPRPSLGSMVASERIDQGFPRSVTLGGTGFGPAFLGSQHGPFVIENIQAAKAQLDRIGSRRRGLDLLAHMNNSYPEQVLDSRTAAVDSVRRLIDTDFASSIDIKSKNASDRNRYGDNQFGQRVLAARDLLGLGVPFVEVQLGGWDTHVRNDEKVHELCGQVEPAWIALMDDLQKHGLWDDTLIVWMGEFGRTPVMNAAAGRDHFPEVVPVVLAGGNLGGKIIGGTDQKGTRRVGPKHTVPDLMATLLTLLGLDVDAEYTTEFGSPTTVTDQGTPIAELV